MSIGINKDEMREAASIMSNDRELLGKLKPLIESYRMARDFALEKMHEYDGAEILYAQFRGKFNVYNQVIADLESLVPEWLKSELSDSDETTLDHVSSTSSSYAGMRALYGEGFVTDPNKK